MGAQRPGIISIGDVEAAAASGAKSLPIAAGCVVTPSARERAAELGIELASGKAHDPQRQALRAQVESLARKAVAQHGGDPALVEPITNAVMRRIAGPCPCGDH